MPTRHMKLRIATLAAVSAACLTLSGCGGSSGNAVQLLSQTFCGAHRVNSGNLNAALTLVPTGSRTLTGPISLSISGPFQSMGAGKLPKSDLTIALGALGNSISASVISTGTNGYVTLGGASYQLPQPSYQRLESSFSTFAHPPGCSSHSGLLGQLHLHPLRWLTSPQVSGTENVGGVSTTHIHAGINVAALMSDLGTFLKNAPTLGLGGSFGLSGSTLAGLANQIKDTSFDVWTGSSDRTLRKASIRFTLPVTGQYSALLGGLRAANIDLTLQYAGLNAPQTVSAPTSLQPYSQLKVRLSALLSAIRAQITGLLSGGLAGSAPSGSTGAGSAGSGKLQAYSQCVQAAGGDVGKIQKCAPLIGGK